MRKELLKESLDIKKELLKQLKSRGIEIDFKDMETSLNHLVMLKLSMNWTSKKVVEEFIQYYLENYEAE